MEAVGGAGEAGNVLHYRVQTPSPNPCQASALFLLQSDLIDEISVAADDGVAASLPAGPPTPTPLLRRSPFKKVKKKEQKNVTFSALFLFRRLLYPSVDKIHFN